MAKLVRNVVGGLGAGAIDYRLSGLTFLMTRLSQTGRFLDQHLSGLLRK